MVAIGFLLGERYRLDWGIAAGGMGEVWKATDLALGRPVAVKLLQPGYAGHEEGLARFRAEARYAGSLSHPGIARVYDYGEPGSSCPPYLVMELVDGPSLATLLEEGPVDPPWAMSLIAQAARALAAAHAAGLVHRDIKPGNLLVSRDGQVKITDFGIAHAAGSEPVTRTGALMGTPAYLAPERAAGASATPAADLYALGIVAYQCLTGSLPFTGEPLAVALAHQEQPLPPLPPWVPAGVADLVASLTAKDPGARPASAGQAADQAERARAALTGGSAIPHIFPALAHAAPGTPITPVDEPPPSRRAEAGIRQHRKHSRRTLGGLASRTALALAAATAVVAAGWVMTGMLGHAPVQGRPGPPSATHHPTPRSTHLTQRVLPAAPTGGATGIHHPHGHARPPAASRKPRRPSGKPTGKPTGIPTPTGSPTPTATSTPIGTSTTAPSPTPSPAAGLALG